MTSRIALLTLLLILIAGQAEAQASGGCELTLNPETSGFFLSPTIEKLTVVEAVPTDPEVPCVLIKGDELLQVNDQAIPGRKAREVMKYWEAIPKTEALRFNVIRDGEAMIVVMD